MNSPDLINRSEVEKGVRYACTNLSIYLLEQLQITETVIAS